MKPRSGRTIPLYFKVSPQEKEIIDKIGLKQLKHLYN